MIEDAVVADDEIVPTALENKFVEPFEMITEQFGTPVVQT